MAEDFPLNWKLARLVLIPKGTGKAMDDPTAYRHLCLLSVISKLYECMIRERLRQAIENSGGLSRNQHGFRKGYSTIDAVEAVMKVARIRSNRWCILVTLDVQNAFNTAAWSLIIGELIRRKIPRYLIAIVNKYLETRRISVYGKDMTTTARVP
ncbi:hypothetical protein JTB14_008936 [Gonioctena quinquepunctata]|nr:hypothetical protein JTB14_008936 [Gonioctena quinquepunctata]